MMIGVVVIRGREGAVFHSERRCGRAIRQEAAWWIKMGFIVLGVLTDDYPLVQPLRTPTRFPKLPDFNAVTGACMCTSFRWNTYTGKCLVCEHEAHGSRIHCGVLR